MDEESAWDTAVLLLRAATELTGSIQRGVLARGFDDVRPAHGIAFVRISHGGATVVELADHLGVTKQAASQMAKGLVAAGYLTRTEDPSDGRSRRLELTAKGWACTRAAQEAGAEQVLAWRLATGARALDTVRTALGAALATDPTSRAVRRRVDGGGQPARQG